MGNIDMEEKVNQEINSMSEEEIIKEYNEYQIKDIDMSVAYNVIRYDKLWIAYNSLARNCKWNEKDKMYYPKFGWISGKFKGLEFLNTLTKALNRLDKVKASGGVVYDGCAYHNSKIIWTIHFEDIESFNHFLWAGCYRYMPITHNDKWFITPSIGDPNYMQKDIVMDFCYQDLNAEREEWEKDVNSMASCILTYAEHQNDMDSRILARTEHQNEHL